PPGRLQPEGAHPALAVDPDGGRDRLEVGPQLDVLVDELGLLGRRRGARRLEVDGPGPQAHLVAPDLGGAGVLEVAEAPAAPAEGRRTSRSPPRSPGRAARRRTSRPSGRRWAAPR